MPKSISIDSHIFDGIAASFGRLKDTVAGYFTSITRIQQYAWMAMGLGIVCVVVALILW